MKKFFSSLLTVVFLFSLTPLALAEEFAVNDYTFDWNVAKVGDAKLAVQKDPKGLRFFLGSLGGKMATVSMTAAEAAAVGSVLLKTEEYYDAHKKYYETNQASNKPMFNKEQQDIVKTGENQVVFYSSPRGKEFTVKVGETKTFSTMALMTKDEALKMGAYLVKAEKMAAFINGRIKF